MPKAPRATDIVVIQSSPRPLPTTNPYNIMLMDSLRSTPGLDLRTFSWRTALIRRVDVFHAHWPEALISGRRRTTTLIRQALYLLFLIKLKLTRAAIVRTIHNLELPQGISRRDTWLLRATEKLTTLRIVINSSTPVTPDQPHEVILHGHYQGWFQRYPQELAIPGRFGYFGRIRRYKSADRLVRAFCETHDPTLSLRVGGSPSSPELAATLEQLSGGDPRVRFSFGFLQDEDLVSLATSSQIIVLPYPDMHNSGSVLASLSLNRPVLVPRNQVNERLAEEVGPGWVYMFDDELVAGTLLEALAHLNADVRAESPDLSARDWDLSGAQHLVAFRRALDIVRRPSSRTPTR